MEATPETLSHYYMLVPQCSRTQFKEKHSHPFLVRIVDEDDDHQSAKFSTDKIKKQERSRSSTGTVIRSGTAQVYPIIKQPGNAFENMINVGRAPNNDVALAYTSISKFHAFFSVDAETNSYSLTDANATNGTFVNRQRLVPDTPHLIHNGDRLGFSPQVSAYFFDSGSFYDWVCATLEEMT